MVSVSVIFATIMLGNIKIQRKGKALENGTKENPGTGVRTSGQTNMPPSWLGQFA